MNYEERIAQPIISVANRLGAIDAYGRLRSSFKSQVVILLYHRVGPYKDIWSLEPVDTSDFEDQIRYLIKAHNNILPLDELARYIREKRPLPRRTVAITFDDGYKDIFLHAYPILKRYNVPATIFLATGHIGTANLFWFDRVRYVLWNTELKSLELDELGTIPLDKTDDRVQSFFKVVERLKEVTEKEKNVLIEGIVKASDVNIPPDLGKQTILSWDEVKEMNDNGISFGAHTVTHPIMTRVSLEQAKYEITESKKEIEGRLGQPVTTFSYPEGGFGDFNTRVTDLLKEAGFGCAVTTIPQLVAPKTDLYALGRISPGERYDLFKFFVCGLHNDLRGMLSRIDGMCSIRGGKS